MRILAQVRFVSAANRVTYIVELRQDEQCAVLDLFNRIRHAIGTVHLNLARDFIYGEFVVLEIKFAIRQSQILNHTELRRLL